MTDLEVLELFNDKAETIRNYHRLMEALQENKLEFKKPSNSDIGEVTFYGADQELISAGILTIRYFIQNNESISFYNMKNVYERLPISQAKKDEFNQVRDEVNRYLDAPSPLTVSKSEQTAIIVANDLSKLLTEMDIDRSDIKTYTNREILELLVYGHFSHANERKRVELKKICSMVILQASLWQIFVTIITNLINSIFAVENINKSVITEIKSP